MVGFSTSQCKAYILLVGLWATKSWVALFLGPIKAHTHHRLHLHWATPFPAALLAGEDDHQFSSPMALQTLRSLHALRYTLSPLSSLRFLSTPPISEHLVLNELSDLLSPNPNPKPPIPIPFPPKPPQEPSNNLIRDRILSPDEKLRGVFILNLKGKSAVNAALTSTGVDLTNEILKEVVNKGDLNGNSIVSFFDWAIEQPGVEKSVESYNVIVRALGRRKFFRVMEDFVVVRMRDDGIRPSLETLEIVVDSFVRGRRVSKAVELFRKVEEVVGLSCDVDSFNVLVRCLCRRSHVTVANSLFNSMRGKILFDSVSYNEIIGGWARFGRVDKVESFWEMMRVDGLSPDQLTFAYMIEALGRAGRISDALDLFGRMEKMGCSLNTIAYNAMISNYVSVGDLEEAMKFYKDMCEDDYLPDMETYDKLITALLKVRRVADALELFDVMLGQGVLPSTGMITSFLEPLCSFGPPHAAMVIYKKSRKAGCRLSMKAYKLLLMRLSRFGKSGMVLKIWDEMQESGYNSDKEVYEYIVNGLCNIGQVDNAVLVVEEALHKGFCLGKVVYSKLNSKLMEMNKVETSYKLYLKVKGVRRGVNSQRFWRASGWHF